ncbi:glycosyltransferase [Mucilaginibacter sp. BT774]|uniref:glycosyltransferase n=1 Tax=Mucilaginibacter sp. BT774 TaxID=3062276 RepID=UPI002675319E|nr:glycosyltransferase [Mucilaginibacter sp. BT774]MDO3627494.1 glycosyltransferase [Mucilaginibacter sp. BT774]
MDQFNLSYIIATRNRLSFLKITLENLLRSLHADEEIVVVDGDSSDGSKEYLMELFEKNKIHQYLSEPDRNQANAWNKAMLMARGKILKKIMDDDVFCYYAIRRCKQYMLDHPEADALISNDLSSALNDHGKIDRHSRYPQFEKWSKGIVPSFTFGDVHMLIRKSSLAYLGLYNVSFTMMDWEYALRISYLNANIVFYTGYNALNVFHSQTVSSLKDQKQIEKQGRRAAAFYEYKGDQAEISLWSRIKIFVGKHLKKKNSQTIGPELIPDAALIYEHYYQRLNEINDSEKFTFIRKEKA